MFATPTRTAVKPYEAQAETRAERRRGGRSIPWPLLPFLVFCFALEVVPLSFLVRDSLRVGGTGAFTFDNFTAITEPLYWHSLRNSIVLSAVTAAIGSVWGVLVSIAIFRRNGRAKRWLISLVAATSNFSGIPLALAFISVLGASGFITLLLREGFGIRLYPRTFTLYSWTGLTLIYVYFQLPLMVLLFSPALARLKPHWPEAASTLGASTWTYWRRVGIPVLAAPFAASFSLLFANALGAYATAWGLSGGKLSLLTIQIAFEVNGDISYNPGLAAALSLILALLMAVSILVAQLLSRRAQRWLR